ncbi:MAG: acetate--CoA ligase family protein [Gemmatimonadota bacterium]|nr:MAG: acetate--CoA ligase family protein [Gemmatimonadota bacterium]
MRHDLDYIFRPRSVAVIGASRREDSVGGQLLRNLFRFEFNGPVFPINPKAKVVHSTKCYPSVLDVPDEIDLAVIVVPKQLVPKMIDDCGKKGVKGIVMITAGFREVGPKGIEAEEKLIKKIRKYGMRMVGPNCFGVINTDPDVRLNATFATALPLPGKIGFLSQSGALGEAILDHASQLNLGLSMFVSVGNKADVAGNDLLEYWKDDPQTELILLYLESFGDPRRFTMLARSIVQQKPIIVVKAGRTEAGARAASSHTGALAGLDVAAEALLDQCGVLRVRSMEELFDVSEAFANQPIPKGQRVAIVTNAGGPGILAADACVSLGLDLPPFNPKTITTLRKFSNPEASYSNPMDMVSGAGSEQYRKTLKAVLQDNNVDAVIVIFVPPITIDPVGVAQAIIAASQNSFNKPILCCFMSAADERSGIKDLKRNRLPVYLFPESAALALSAMVKYGKFRERKTGKIGEFKVKKKKAETIFTRALRERREYLTEKEVVDVLEAYGIPFPKAEIANTYDEALERAEKLEFPVALKIVSPEVIHKSDIGGVVLDIRNEAELIRGIKQIVDATKPIKKKLGEFQIMIQEMITGGKETILGMIQDPKFGPLIMFGMGGIYVETFKDVNFRIHPITDIEALEMVKTLKSFPLLKGVRGEKPVAFDVIAEMLQRVSQLVSDFNAIQEMDVNPFIAFPEREKCTAVDGRIRIRLDS